MGMEQGLGGDLERWLTPFLEVVERKTRRTWTPLYVQGLLGPEGRRSVQPMAARLGLSSHDQLDTSKNLSHKRPLADSLR